MKFYLGAPPAWIRHSDVPLFVSNRPLSKLRTLHPARGLVAIDSGGFTELATHGTWTHGPTPREYANQVRRYADEIGIVWAAPQDWMCEPWITAKTGLSVAEHQARTIGSYLDLKAIDARLPVIPVVQGWTLADYERCLHLYDRAGITLAAEPVVGLGSVCRRQATSEAADLVYSLAALSGLRLHGFGFKTEGLQQVGHLLASADSMAWSYRGRREPAGCDYRAPGSRGPHKNEANCLRYALDWRRRVLAAIDAGLAAPRQLALDLEAAA